MTEMENKGAIQQHKEKVGKSEMNGSLLSVNETTFMNERGTRKLHSTGASITKDRPGLKEGRG